MPPAPKPVPRSTPTWQESQIADLLERVRGLEQRERELERRLQAIEARQAAPERSGAETTEQFVSHRDAAERARILGALRSTQWNRTAAAATIGMPRRTFTRRLRELGIQAPGSRRAK